VSRLQLSLYYLFVIKTGTSGRMWDINKDLNKQYGPLARIGPNELITGDPDIVRQYQRRAPLTGVRAGTPP